MRRHPNGKNCPANFTDKQLVDLSGNAFSFPVVHAVLLSIFLCAPIEKAILLAEAKKAHAEAQEKESEAEDVESSPGGDVSDGDSLGLDAFLQSQESHNLSP